MILRSSYPVKPITRICIITLLSFMFAGCASRRQRIDYLAPSEEPLWFSHPVIGDVSFDNFDRGNAILVHRGSEPYRWPVNCSLFRDDDGMLYAYITRYTYGYWPPQDSGAYGLHSIYIQFGGPGALVEEFTTTN